MKSDEIRRGKPKPPPPVQEQEIDSEEAAEREANFQETINSMVVCEEPYRSPIQRLGEQIEQMLPPDQRTPEMGKFLGERAGFAAGAAAGYGAVKLIAGIFGRIFRR